MGGVEERYKRRNEVARRKQKEISAAVSSIKAGVARELTNKAKKKWSMARGQMCVCNFPFFSSFFLSLLFFFFIVRLLFFVSFAIKHNW